MPETIEEAAARLMGMSKPKGLDIPILPPVGGGAAAGPGVAARPVRKPVAAAETVEEAADRLMREATQAVGVSSPSGGSAYRNARARLADPEVADAYRNLEGAARSKGYRVELRSGDRNREEQWGLYRPAKPQAGKRTRIQANGLLVAHPDDSPHVNGTGAVDVRVYDSRGKRVSPSVIAGLAKEHNFDWLGPADPPHFTFRRKKGSGTVTTRQSASSLLNTARARYADLEKEAPAYETPEQAAERLMAGYQPRNRPNGTPATGMTPALAERASQPAPLSPTMRQLADEVFGPNSYDPGERRERRERNPVEKVFNAVGQAVSIGLPLKRESDREFSAQQAAGRYPRYARLDPKNKAAQVQQLNTLHDLIGGVLNRKVRADFSPEGRRGDYANLKRHAYALSFDDVAQALDKKLTPWQRRNLGAALARVKWEAINQEKVQGGFALDIGLGMGGEALQAAAAARLTPRVTQLLARTGRAAPILARAVESGTVGGGTGLVQGPLQEYALNPNAKPGDYFRAAGTAGGAGLALGFGLGAGGTALFQALRGRSRTPAPAAGTPRSGTLPPEAEALIPVDRHPTTGRFVPKGKGQPVQRVPTLKTATGAMRLTPGVEVTAPQFSRATFRVEQVLPGNRVALRSTVNGMKLETTLDRLASPEAAPDLPTGPLDTPATPAPTGPTQVTPSTTGLGEIGGAGRAIADNLYDMLWRKVEAGDVTEGGKPSAVLQVAKLARDKGHLNTSEEFRVLAGRVQDVRNQGLKGKEYQNALRRTLTDWVGEREAAAAAARREAGDWTTQGEAAFGEASLTKDGRIRRSAVEHPLTAEETEDLLLARRFRENPEDPEVADWLETAPMERVDAALASVENPSVARAVQELEARRQAVLERGLVEETRGMVERGERGRALLQRIAGQDRVMSPGADGKKRAYWYIQEQDRGHEDELFRLLNTPGRQNKTYHLQGGTADLRTLIYDHHLLPGDAVQRRGGLAQQAAQKELAARQKVGPAAAATEDIPTRTETTAASTTAPPAEPSTRLDADVERLRQKVSRLEAETSRSSETPSAGVAGGENRSATLARQHERNTARYLEAGRELQQAKGELERLERLRKGVLSGELHENGQPRKDAPSAKRKANAVEELTGFLRERLKPGDLVDVGGNGPLAVKRVNAKSITTEGGSTWEYGKFRPQSLGGEQLTADELRVEFQTWREQQAPTRLEAATATRQAAQDEVRAALEAARKATAEARAAGSGKLLSPLPGLPPVPDEATVRAYLPVARALVKLGHATAKELEAALVQTAEEVSAAFARRVRELLEQQDGPLAATQPEEGSGAASKTPTPLSGTNAPRRTESGSPTTNASLSEATKQGASATGRTVDVSGSPSTEGQAGRQAPPPTNAPPSSPIVPRTRRNVNRATPPAERVGKMNLTRFTGDEAKAEIWRTVAENEDLVATQRRGVRSGAETRQAAEALGITLEDLRKVKPGTAANAETLEAVGGIVQHLSNEVTAARKAWAANKTDENLLRLQAAREEQLVALSTFKGMEAEAGRALGQLGRLRQELKPKPATVEEAVAGALAPERVPATAPEPTPPVSRKQNRLPIFAEEPGTRTPGRGGPSGRGERQVAPRVRAKREATAEAKAEAAASLEKLLQSLGGRQMTVLPGGVPVPDAETIEAAVAFARSLVKLGYASAAELEAGFREHVKGSSAAFARMVREALEKEDGALDKPLQGKTPAQAAAAESRVGQQAQQATIPGTEAPPAKGVTPRTPAQDAASAARAKQIGVQPDLFGENNWLYELEPAAAARERLHASRGGATAANAGDLLELGGFYAEGGARTYEKWSQAMRRDLGEKFTDAELRPVFDRLRAETTKRARQQLERDQAMERLLDSFGGRDEMVKEANELAKIGDDPIAVAKWVRDRNEMTPWQGVMRYYRGNILSGPGTHLRNIVSTASMVAMQSPEKLVASVLDVPVRAAQKLFLGVERPAGYTARDTMAGFAAGWKSGVPTGARRLVETLKHGLTAEEAARLEVGSREFRGGGKNPFNWNARAMGATDQFFKGMVFESERASLAMRQAMREGRKGTELQHRVAELIEDANILDQAEASAREFTFNEEPDKAVRWLLAGRKVPYLGPVLEVIMPFVSTPTNVLKQTARYSPLGLARLFDPAVRSSEQASRVLAQAAIGTATWATFAHIVNGSDITLSAPKEVNARDAFYRSGRKPYSIKIGGRWVSYSGQGPLTTILSTVAATKEEVWKKGDKTEPSSFMRVGLEALKGFREQSFLSGVSALLDALDEPERFAERWAAQQASGLIPFSALLRATANATDDTLRDAKSVGDRLKAQLPSLSQTVAPLVDNLGRDVKRQPAGLVALQPFVGAPDNNDPVEKELARLKIYPGATPDSVKVKNQDVPLTAEQARGLQRAVGQASYEAAAKKVNSAYYRSHSDERKLQVMEKAIQDARRDARRRYLRSQGVRIR